MHTEALLNYIRYRVKEELSTAKGNVKEAKEWGQLAKDAATAAKINPSQLSKADLSDGLSTFSELSQAVEREVDIIPILPRFKCRPNDALDFNIWCYICLLYTSDAADDLLCVDLGGRRILKKKKTTKPRSTITRPTDICKNRP